MAIPLATTRQGSPLRLPHPRVRQRRLPQLAPPSDFDLVLKAVPRSAISHLKATFRSPVATFRSPVGNTAPHRGTAGATEPRPARYHVCGHGHPRIGFQMSRSLMLAPPCSASRVPIIIIAAHLPTRCGNQACWKPGFTHPRMLHTRVYHTCMPQAVLVSLAWSIRWVCSSAIVTRRRRDSGYIPVLEAHVACPPRSVPPVTDVPPKVDASVAI